MKTTENQALVLYYAPDNASLIVRLLLEELALPYQTVLVDRSTNQQQSENYLKLNPSGLIPVCIINGEPVFETAAILLAIADKHGEYFCSVNDPRRPRFLKWLFFLSNSLHSDLRQRFYPEKFVGDDANAVSRFSQIVLQRLMQRFAILEACYQESDEPYFAGADPTIIDLYLAVCFRWVQLYPVHPETELTASGFAAISTMVKNLERRPAIRGACAKEGISGNFFSAPEFANPPEGVAL